MQKDGNIIYTHNKVKRIISFLHPPIIGLKITYGNTKFN
jgi:hypothetical protein